MRNKKVFSLCAVALTLALFSGCAATNKVNFDNYWDTDSLLSPQNVRETLTYDVTFDNKNASSIGYELAYTNGTYTTDLVFANGNYTYTSTFSIDVTYTLNGASKNFTDSITSTVVFTTAENALYPVSSTKTVFSHSPVGTKQTNVENCYKEYNYKVTTTYSDTKGVCETVNNVTSETKQTTFKTNGDHRYLDNEQLLFAFRGFSNSTSSGKFLVYSPFVRRLQSVNFALSENAKENFTFTKNGENKEREISYRVVQMQLNEKNPGSIQTAKYAAVTNPSSNEYRNVMLSLETPLPYNLGKLVYILNSATYQ